MVTKDKLVLLKKSPSNELIDTINKILMHLQVEGAKGNLGPDITLTATKNELRNVYDNMIIDLINYQFNTNTILIEIISRKRKLSELTIIKFVIERMKCYNTLNCIYNWKSKIVSNFKAVEVIVPVSQDAILKILRHKMGINENLMNMLKHKTTFNKNTHIECSSIDYELIQEELKELTFKDDGLEYILNEGEIENIITQFKSCLDTNKITGCLVSNVNQCPLCYKEDNIRNFSYFPNCNHTICNDCQSCLNQISQYKPGDFVVPYSHKCCTCCRIHSDNEQIMAVFQKYDNNLPSNIKLRFCSEVNCSKLFEYTLTCGGDESVVPLYCEEHRIIDVSAKNCPQCNTLVSKNDGCDHMACICGAHWCWGCQYSFSERMIPLLDNIWWKCYEDCDASYETSHIEQSDNDLMDGYMEY